MAWFAGVKRSEINWAPSIDPDKCVKCGMCMNCGKNVYKWTKNGPIVQNPLDCVVGCTTCANLCLGEAITFPPLQELKEFYKKHGIWSKVKKQLKESGKIF
ncbi:4Fe-4S ferredoxin [Thermotomaculum hydrothermale]|uniref:4Fe-4S ferredoxin n=1 Tax=Thermotomaculum hydrothermale TaxID=981385 RepID=A0A7R6SZD1_9BACT|nr:hypothetical protein [Thermotomaculum hydrothermale]BBB32612.1 4Fe-4S ferredoxin [Thermotomaculum hydrothermale]